MRPHLSNQCHVLQTGGFKKPAASRRFQDQAIISHEQFPDMGITKFRDDAATRGQMGERACGFPHLMDKRRRVVS
jgi:hypothetical protein